MSNASSAKILITGGHMTPAFAVINELRNFGYTDIEWVGHKYNQATSKAVSPEYTIVTQQLSLPFHPLTAGKLMFWITPQNFLYVLRDYLRIPVGFWQARKLLKTIKPAIVVSFGGYLAVPVVFWAKRMKIKVITHEQTVVQGRANKWIISRADKVLVSWPVTLTGMDATKTVLTGNPIRQDVLQVKSDNYRFQENLPVLFITGGNQGSYNMSRRILRVLPEVLEHFNVIHQTGESTDRETYQKALLLRDRLPFNLRNRYIAKPFIFGDEIGEVYAKSDIVFARSGANTIAEIAALGKLSVFMPIGFAAGSEQRKNAEMLQATGLATICRQTDAIDEPWRVLNYLMQAKQALEKGEGFNGKPIEECQDIAAKLIKLDAANRMTKEIISLLNR